VGGWVVVSWLDTALSAARTVADAAPAPRCRGLVFAVVWPIAGFPWWPLALVLGLGVVLRVLGFGYLIAGRRGPILLVALLVVTTLLAWTPWAAVTALGAGLAVAGGFRFAALAAARTRHGVVPRRRRRLGRRDRHHRPGAGGGLGADQRVQPGPAAAPHPRETLGAVMATVAADRHVRGLLPVHRPRPGPTGGRLGRPDRPGAVAA
jgi:hypothetical protein